MELSMPQTMRVSNSRDYTRILKNRSKIFGPMHQVLQTESLLFVKSRRSKLKYSDDLILCMYIVACTLGLPLRQTCGFFEDYVEKNRIIAQIPNYSTLSRRLKKVTCYLSRPKRKHLPFNKELAIDSTCLNIYSNTGSHSKDYSTVRQFSGKDQVRKMHVALDIHTKVVDEIVYSDWSYTDHAGCLDLIDLLGNKCQIDSIRADRAYDRKPCYEACHKKGIKPIIPPIVTAVRKKQPIFKDRNRAIELVVKHGYEEGIGIWKRQTSYGKRSYVEAFFGRFKKTFGFSLRSKCEANREQEMRIKCKILNQFAALGMPTFELV